ncbi:7202_t:CDS:2 [Paraglomus brasilianum]|uniref:7202_t:CDS:1 n=1 Tax=Paraglomus brasilianum TaxID=144538 RepID=A0A9N9AZD7_9GLOM|nr:7202_t:CDS:2 [Paraglomus brasilianum]
MSLHSDAEETHFLNEQNLHTVLPGLNRKNVPSHKYLGLGVLGICVASFVAQTEITQFVQKDMEYHKPYFILWISHSCYTFIIPLQIAISSNPRNYIKELFMVGSQLVTSFGKQSRTLLTDDEDETECQIDATAYDMILSERYRYVVVHLFKLAAFFATSLCVPAYIWYIAVNLIAMANLTAIYNTSCFFAYIFSILLLGESLKLEKVIAVALSVIGIVIMSNQKNAPKEDHVPMDYGYEFVAGNVIACIGASFYGLYEVLYKKYASPSTPSGLFANTLTGLMGVFTFLVLWIPIPILHITGVEPFALPSARTFGYILLNASAGVFFNASFMFSIALTSPLFASIGIMVTIPIVTLVDMLVTQTSVALSTVVGSLCILTAFGLLIWDDFTRDREKQSSQEEDIG